MKKILLLITLFLTLAAPMRAQVYIMEEDENQRVENVSGNGEWNNIIIHGSGDDQTNYLPLGDGLLLLAALGGVRLIRRQKEETDYENK